MLLTKKLDEEISVARQRATSKELAQSLRSESLMQFRKLQERWDPVKDALEPSQQTSISGN